MRISDDELLLGTPSCPELFGEFYRRYEGVMLVYFSRRVHDGEVAADLAAETFAQALVSVERFDADIGGAAQWLFGIAGHVLSRSARRRRVEFAARRQLGLLGPAVDDELASRIEALADIEQGGRALELLAELPEEQREAVRQRILLDDDYDAIARAMRCSQAAARQRVSRGLAHLRRGLARTV